MFKEKLVEDLLIEVHRQWIELNRPKSTSGKQESKISHNKGLESIIVMESNLLLPAIPKASVKPIRKSLWTSYSKNQRDLSVEKGVFADIHIPERRYLMEVTGELLRKSEYKNNPENNFSLLGTPLAHVFFYRSIDICIDARYAGNDTRYIRRSCCPNSEIKSIILPNDSDDQTIHMGIYTSEEVDRGEEITIGWNWHRGLLMWHKNKEFLRKNHKVDIDASERKTLKKTLKLLINEYGECACEDKDECLIECLKDELERGDGTEDETPSSTTKKKRLNSKPRANERKSEVKKPRASDIFSSDEEINANGSRRSSIKENKTIHFINKNTTKKKPIPIPSSPAVSVTESIDIDIMSMSPAPSEGDSDTHITGSKRTRPISTSGIQLPCKKRWLHEYMSQQQELKAKMTPSSPTEEQNLHNASHQIDTNKENSLQKHEQTDISLRPTENDGEDNSLDIDGELSDIASSESTLPLEDTPTTSQNDLVNESLTAENVDMNTKQDAVKNEIKEEKLEHNFESKDSITEDALLEPSTDIKETLPSVTKEELSTEMDDTKVMVTHQEQAVIVESTEQAQEKQEEQPQPSNEVIEEVKPAPRKLTLQEYLSLRRGNLPTPDEKPAAE